MILKNLTRKKTGTGQLVRYIFRYILNEEKQASDQQSNSPFIITHNIRNKSVEGYIQEFKDNLLNRTYKRADQTIIHHTILSWSHKDAPQITDSMLRDIGAQFIKLRGENNLFVGTKHVDRQHTHIHFAVSGNQLNGRSSRLSKQAFTELKLTLDAYQKHRYPELVNSLPLHGRSMALKRARKDLFLAKGEGMPESQNQPKIDKDLQELGDLRAHSKEIEQDQEIEGLERDYTENTEECVEDVESTSVYKVSELYELENEEFGELMRKGIS